MSRNDFPPLNMIIEGGRLVPATQFDEERLHSFRRGMKVKVRITEERDRVLIRKWWAVIDLVVKQCDVPWKTKDEASEAIKLALGIVNLTKTVKGDFLAYPKSLTELEDPELQDAVDQMIALLSRITGVDVDTLNRESAHAGHDYEVTSSEPPTRDEDDDAMSSEPADSTALDNAGSSNSNSDAASSTASDGEAAGTPPRNVNTPASPSLSRLDIPESEMLYLMEYARKALDDAERDELPEVRETNIENMKCGYRDALEDSPDALKALDAMDKAIAAVIRGKRTRAQAAAYIAGDILYCDTKDLERRI